MLVNTVHTKHDIAKAKEARRLQGMIGNLPTRNSRGWYVKNLSPFALSLCKTLRIAYLWP
jgi:hypothetical protein